MENVAELVKQAQAGRSDAFGRLVVRFERTALALAYAIVGDAQSAGDVAQEAFLRAWRKLRSLRQPERFATWLATIVRNVAVEHQRRIRPVEPMPERVMPAADVATAETEMRQRLHATIAELDHVTRSAVILRYYEGLSSAEIGEMLDLSPAAVDMRLSRARQELRTKLGDLYEAFQK